MTREKPCGAMWLDESDTHSCGLAAGHDGPHVCSACGEETPNDR